MALVLALAPVTLGGCAARSAAMHVMPDLGDWSALARRANGRMVRVEATGNRVVPGRLVRVTNDALGIWQGASDRTFARPEVRRVVLVQRQTSNGAARGLAIGAIAGGLVGGLAAESNRAPWAFVMALGWGAIGAAIGAASGFSESRETVVYEAPTGSAGNHTARPAYRVHLRRSAEPRQWRPKS